MLLMYDEKDEVETMQTKVLSLLKIWNEYAKRDFYIHPKNEKMQSYGTGYGGWAVQTNQKAIASYAIEGIVSGNKEAVETALKMLRFCLESHIDGTGYCFDGNKWGHTWISTLGIERMMHAVYPLMKYMTEEDRRLLRKILISEADWLLEEYTILAGLYNENQNNKPESNAWNGAFLFRVASMYPDAPNADKYKEKANVFLFNAITTLSDSQHPLYIGANFFESMALNHHGYLNVGYMVITLSQIAMLHFYCKEADIEPPKYLYHNANKLWQLVKSLTAPDGRLMRVGGDTRIRYCYCQDYAIPVWLFAKDYFHDSDADKFLEGWLGQVKKEMKHNGDGSFLSDRCYKLHDPSPIYYTRLESDRACSLSMILAWVPMIDRELSQGKGFEKVEPFLQWEDAYHGAAFIQDDSNIRSWTWRGDGGPVGLCFPKADSSLAEWHNNMVGEAEGIGRIHNFSLKEHKQVIFEGGFATMGSIDINGKIFLAEQQSGDYVAEEQIACAALPDGATMVVFQLVQNPDGACTILHQVKGLNLKVPNDLFNDDKRTYYFEGNKMVKGCLPETEEEITLGQWVNVDNKVGVYKLYGKKELTLFRPKKRMGEIAEHYMRRGIDTGSLYCDVIYAEHENDIKKLWKPTPLVDTGFVITCDNAELTAIRSKRIQEKISITCSQKECLRYAQIAGKDGRDYLFVVNFSKESLELGLQVKTHKLVDLCNDSAAAQSFWMEAQSFRLFVIEQTVAGG